jgi:TonB-dependent SusC/RagA subfamily outer membrane receptor
MNKNNSTGNHLTEQVPIKHLLMIMRITLILLFTSVLCSMAELGYTQNARVTINKRNATLKEVLNEIESQTDYLFIYNNKVDTNEKVSVRAKQKAVSEVLSSLLKNNDIDYSMEGNHIILSANENSNNLTGSIASLITQQQRKQIRGTVVDESGEAIIGANIVERGTTNGTVTDIDGNFTLSVDNNAVLQISYIGYLDQNINTAGITTFDIILREDTQALEELVVVGYGVQQRQTLTGAVSAISAEDIITTKNENVQNMITGKIPGVRVAQRTAEPGAFNNSFDIRGMGAPLIIIDGVPRSNADFQRLDGNDIESISVLKDASAAIYGVRAANGVVLVTTKGGKVQKNELTYNGTYTWQIPSGLPATIDAIGYMTLRNELAMHSLNESQPLFNEEDFEAYRSGEKKSTDWYSHVFGSHAVQTMHKLLHLTDGIFLCMYVLVNMKRIYEYQH